MNWRLGLPLATVNISLVKGPSTVDMRVPNMVSSQEPMPINFLGRLFTVAQMQDATIGLPNL